MAEIGNWNGHTFIVSPTIVRSFTGLTVKGSSEVEDKKSGSEVYVQRKNAKAREVSMTITLNANLGVDVREEASAFVDEACNGANDYFYVNGNKLVSCMLMLTEASVENVNISTNGVWIGCDVKLTMKQCTKYGGSAASSSSGGNSGKSSSKKPSVKNPGTMTKTTVMFAGDNAITKAVANNGINKTVSTISLAQQHSASIKAQKESSAFSATTSGSVKIKTLLPK